MLHRSRSPDELGDEPLERGPRIAAGARRLGGGAMPAKRVDQTGQPLVERPLGLCALLGRAGELSVELIKTGPPGTRRSQQLTHARLQPPLVARHASEQRVAL